MPRMSTVGLREIKNRLSHSLRRLVRRSERTPGLEALVREGLARSGDGNSPYLYPPMPSVLPSGEARRFLDLERGDR
jgi:hypothetical protein